jgi:hypothetical protein
MMEARNYRGIDADGVAQTPPLRVAHAFIGTTLLPTIARAAATIPICPDDETAKEHARQLIDGHDVELWQGDRKIEAFKHTHE